MTDASDTRAPARESTGGTAGATDAARWPPGPRAVPPGERGATRIADRVITKMAEQAAREALRDLAGGTPPVGESHADAEPGAPTPPIAPAARRPGPRAEVSVRRQPDADGTGGLARVRVEVELDYPCDLAGHCGAIRRRVTERLSDLAGMEVPGVALVVARLHSAHRRTGRVG